MSEQTEEGGGPAFPSKYAPIGSPHVEVFTGLNKREWFAGMALTGVLRAFDQVASSVGRTGRTAPFVLNAKSVAEAAYEIADAMLEEGEKE